jgi:hypothetical protein
MLHDDEKYELFEPSDEELLEIEKQLEEFDD